MKGDIVLPDESPEETCDDCGKGISPQQARDSRHITHQIGGPAAKTLCRKHLDQHEREPLA